MNEKMMIDYLTLLLDQKIAELEAAASASWKIRQDNAEYESVSARFYGKYLGEAEGIEALKDIKARMGL